MPAIAYLNHRPNIKPSVFIAPGAWVIGRVKMKEHSSAWFNTVVRADLDRIEIGKSTNIQDGSIVHVDEKAPCIIGDGVHVGHHANLHGCMVENGCLIGIGSIILSRAVIGEESIIGAGSVVLEGMKIPPRSLAVGVPARIVRSVTQKEIRYIKGWVEKYRKLAADYNKASISCQVL